MTAPTYNQMYPTRRYRSDDHDAMPVELIVTFGENGDYYIGSVVEGAQWGDLVRICTSGGAASSAPGVLRAVQALFQALGGFDGEQKDIFFAAMDTNAALNLENIINEINMSHGYSRAEIVERALKAYYLETQ